MEPRMTTNVYLSKELERFARQCVAEGRYNNVSEVVRSALRMLQDAEDRRRAFNASLVEAVAEADRDGGYTLDQVEADIDGIVGTAE
jgi:antitoxin ParD1/3/4